MVVSPKSGVSWTRLTYFGIAALAGALAGFFGGCLIHDNHDAVEVIVTVFPILAGFLVAIMTIVGDPSVFGGRSWRAAELAMDPTYRSLVRQKWLFLLYLITVAGVFAAALLKKKWPMTTEIIERVYFGLAVGAFVLSLSLPGSLMRIQLERHEAMIARRRSGRGTNEGSGPAA
jgi:hypothetical protein